MGVNSGTVAGAIGVNSGAGSYVPAGAIGVNSGAWSWVPTGAIPRGGVDVSTMRLAVSGIGVSPGRRVDVGAAAARPHMPTQSIAKCIFLRADMMTC